MIARIIATVIITQLCSNSVWALNIIPRGIDRIPFAIIAVASTICIVWVIGKYIIDKWDEGVY